MAGELRPRLYGCSGPKVRITPSNQSLILAGEPTGARGAADPFLDQAARLVASGADLKRVTILASRPNSTVVVQADYFSREEYAGSSSELPALPPASSDVLQLAPTKFSTKSLPGAGSSYRNPVELYARTQRSLETPSRAALLDVLA
jgi:hypothetical protein